MSEFICCDPEVKKLILYRLPEYTKLEYIKVRSSLAVVDQPS